MSLQEGIILGLLIYYLHFKIEVHPSDLFDTLSPDLMEVLC